MKQLVKFKLVHPGAKLPTRGTDGSGAFDFFAPERIVLGVFQKKLFGTGIAHDLPANLWVSLRAPINEISIPFRLQGVLFDRSGLGGKKGVRISFACLIDNDYRGEIQLSMENLGTEDMVWEQGDRLCQIAYVLTYAGDCAETHTLTDTSRGAGGFGSTGR
jgi:dUTPase